MARPSLSIECVKRSLTILALVTVVILGEPAVVAAQVRSASEQRYRELERYLCDLQRPARVYAYSWAVGLGAVTAIQTTLALTSDTQTEGGRAARTGYVVSASLSGFGMVLVAATARPETNSCDVLRARDFGTSEEWGAGVRDAERRLIRARTAARRQTAWWMHGVAGLLGLGVGLGLGFGYPDHTLRATLQGVGTFAFTELRIWTRPTGAIDLAQSAGL